MKNSIVSFSLLLLASFNIVDNKKETVLLQQDMFAGTWKYQNGNEVFIVNLWADADGFKGHFRKIIVDSAGNEVSVVYKSNRKLGPGSNYDWPPAINTGTYGQDYAIGGNISDNTVNMPYGEYKFGQVIIQILNPGCYPNSCSLQAQWTVKMMPGLRIAGEPDFNIPANIILTKQ